jgi:hypothetical protein
MEQAYRSYTVANGNGPKSVSDAIPFFDPPLEPDFAERLVRTYAK